MARIYRVTDRIYVKIDDITVTIRPLKHVEKTEIQSHMAKLSAEGASEGVRLAMKYAICEVQGIVDSDNKPYKVELDEQGVSDECLEDLLNIGMDEKLQMVCVGLLAGVPKEFTDQKNKPLEGVEIVRSRKK